MINYVIIKQTGLKDMVAKHKHKVAITKKKKLISSFSAKIEFMVYFDKKKVMEVEKEAERVDGEMRRSIWSK